MVLYNTSMNDKLTYKWSSRYRSAIHYFCPSIPMWMGGMDFITIKKPLYIFWSSFRTGGVTEQVNVAILVHIFGSTYSDFWNIKAWTLWNNSFFFSFAYTTSPAAVMKLVVFFRSFKPPYYFWWSGVADGHCAIRSGWCLLHLWRTCSVVWSSSPQGHVGEGTIFSIICSPIIWFTGITNN